LRAFFFLFTLTLGSLFATVTNEYPSQKLLDAKIPVVDIRTPSEWRESGLLQGAIPIMFFDERGGYNVEAFLQELQSKVDVTKPFALICRTGSRTKVVSHFLSQEFGYEVIDLQGGMLYIKASKLPVVPYAK
jgi:rhodanese-related sulfurtransferase